MNESYPQFISNDDPLNKHINVALCQCPLPMLSNGFYGHIVEKSGEPYKCVLCKTEFSLCFEETKNEQTHPEEKTNTET